MSLCVKKKKDRVQRFANQVLNKCVPAVHRNPFGMSDYVNAMFVSTRISLVDAAHSRSRTGETLLAPRATVDA